MSSSWWLIFNASMAVYLCIGVGATTRWIGWLTEEADHSLLRLVVRVLYPCLIFSVVSTSAELKTPANLLWPPLLGFAAMAFGFGLARLVSKAGRGIHGMADERQCRTFAACVGIFNYGFIPIPLVGMLFDKATLGVLFVFNVGAELAVWTLGVMIFSGGAGDAAWRRLFNAPSLTIVVALLVNFLGGGGHLPGSLMRTLEWLGQAGIPMSMILIGAIVADEVRSRVADARSRDVAKTVTWAVLLRLVLLPMAVLAAAWLLPLSVELRRVLVIQAAMPCGTFPIVMARHYGGDPAVGLRVVLSTSLLSLLTIPLWIQAGMQLLQLGPLG